MTKTLYPEIAKKYGATTGQVEHCIRNAIHTAGIDKRNAEFIGDVAEELRMAAATALIKE